MKNIFKILLIIIVITLINILIFKQFRNSDKASKYYPIHDDYKRAYDYAVDLEIIGIVQGAYRDTSAHYVKTIFISSDESIIKFQVQSDLSGLYNYVDNGDSIYKNSNSPIVEVFSHKGDTTFILDHGLSIK